MRSLIVFFACLAVCSGWFNSYKSPAWNNLKVKWNFTPFNGFFTMPRTVADAVSNNFVKVSDCDVNAPWRGARYIKNGDYALTLLYDINGYVAGIQTGIPKKLANGFPFPSLRPPFVSDGDRWALTAYFTDPGTICTTGRSEAQFNEEGTGTNLYFQNSTTPEASFKIPQNEADMAATQWTEGKCFVTMGKHWWYNLSVDMKKESMFPAFLLFNGGKLNGFGWAMTTPLPSEIYEHPPLSSYKLFMKEVPKFLAEVETISTLHIFLTKYQIANFC
uniref:Uncharacterized protein n=1 Tax=Arion vulgaris TaxID=1028688 RepID=A0A0B7AVX3_9EUPU